ncbi:CDP-diacylglycerol--glycerol-3-phosphate 3-phosphatidyltransferase [Gammaproteobacteria bacterium]|nr:CDP-diacylglycerol--glycerol-3-phosphate 3-phosphatidyltransferase [Gammaproteobacteria bacterium]
MVIKNLANFFTFLRIGLAPVIFVCLLDSSMHLLALVLFMFASFTDYLDGYFARKTNTVSVIGEVVDPIADKILIVFIFYGLAVNLDSYLIAFAASVIVAREIWVGALRDLNARNSNSDATKVLFISKIKTTIQLFTISIYLLGLSINNMLMIVIADIFLFISVFITLYTGFLYTYNTLK